MKEERIDLSPLDPSRDEARWEAMIQSAVSRGLAARERPYTIWSQLLEWAVPALAVAATAALAVWVGAVIWGKSDQGSATRPAEPTQVLTQWAAADASPATNRILEVLGGHHVED
jgi:negative regulator of sigma E activity